MMGRTATRHYATNALAAKRTVFEQLKVAKARAIEGQPLCDTIVAYSWRGQTATPKLVYLGGFTFEQPGDDDLDAGQGDVLVEETLLLGLHIRCVGIAMTDEPTMETDSLCEDIADEIAAIVRSRPDIAGGNSRTRIGGGQGDYAPTDNAGSSTLALRLEITSVLI